MRFSQFPLSTLKETPSDAEILSHQLMLRAGYIRQVASGLYTWLPVGLRVLKKVENIVRQEMNRAGAIELLMPTVQPAELWRESGRWEQYGAELLRFSDRHAREFCYGPTHEEVITDLVRREIKSYRQLPLNFYQIQLKFRDEVRPRFGIMRAREFVMKDAYSFHIGSESLQATYQAMYDAYCAVFERCGLQFRAVEADTGSIGGNASHEFHVLAASGEDGIAFSDGSDYAANVELAPCLPPAGKRSAPSAELARVATPNMHSVSEVAAFLQVPNRQVVKTLLVVGSEVPVVALVLAGDDELNVIKAEKLPQVAAPLQFADAAAIEAAAHCHAGSIGVVGLQVPMIADWRALALADFITGANEDGVHLSGVNWQRDVDEPQGADLRNIREGDPSPDGNGVIHIERGIEVGHIFQLGDKYSKALNASVLAEDGKAQILTMGCYGIGVSRIVGAAIEQHNDARGICLPAAIAPFDVVIIGVNIHKSDAVQTVAEEFYQQALAAHLDAALDDRDARAGVKFADCELIGIAHRLVVSDKTIANNQFEYQTRDGQSQLLSREEVQTLLQNLAAR